MRARVFDTGATIAKAHRLVRRLYADAGIGTDRRLLIKIASDLGISAAKLEREGIRCT